MPTWDEIQAVIDAWNGSQHGFWELWGLFADEPDVVLPPGSPTSASGWWIALAVVLGVAGIGAVWISGLIAIDDDRPLYRRPGVLGLAIGVALLGGTVASLVHHDALDAPYQAARARAIAAIPEPANPQQAIPEMLAEPLLAEHGLTILPAEPVDWPTGGFGSFPRLVRFTALDAVGVVERCTIFWPGSIDTSGLPDGAPTPNLDPSVQCTA